MSKTSAVLGALMWASLGIVSGGQAAHAAGPMVLASIGLFGPNGEVISYEKEGSTIHIRVCQRNTLASEISGEQGCQLADGTSEVVIRDARGSRNWLDDFESRDWRGVSQELARISQLRTCRDSSRQEGAVGAAMIVGDFLCDFKKKAPFGYPNEAVKMG